MRLIKNQIKTPDGTILTSYHVHDYKTYLDKNGETYMVDGGTHYAKRNVTKIPAIECSIYENAPFSLIRDNLHWGTRGEKGDQALHWVVLSSMSTEHIKNILATEKKIDSLYKKFFLLELEHRGIKF